MAFSIVGVLSVLLEALRPVLPLLIAILAVDLALLGWLLRQRQRWQVGRAVRVAAVLGGLVFLISLLVLPGFTRAGFSNLHGLLDYGILLLASLGLGITGGLLCYPLAQAASRSPA